MKWNEGKDSNDEEKMNIEMRGNVENGKPNEKLIKKRRTTILIEEFSADTKFMR